MTFYESEILRIRRVVYSNGKQLNSIIKIRTYIDNNYNEDLSLNLLADVRYMSKYHLLRLFRKYYGQTPKQYLTEKRIEKSKEYLKKGMNVAEVCFSIGFESPCSFSTLFKNRTGLTPTEFQKEQLSQRLFTSGLGSLTY